MREIFESHPLKSLRKEVAKTNIKGFSTMKKADLVNVMLRNVERFRYMKMYVKPKPKKKLKKKQKPFSLDEFEKALAEELKDPEKLAELGLKRVKKKLKKKA